MEFPKRFPLEIIMEGKEADEIYYLDEHIKHSTKDKPSTFNGFKFWNEADDGLGGESEGTGIDIVFGVEAPDGTSALYHFEDSYYSSWVEEPTEWGDAVKVEPQQKEVTVIRTEYVTADGKVRFYEDEDKQDA